MNSDDIANLIIHGNNGIEMFERSLLYFDVRMSEVKLGSPVTSSPHSCGSVQLPLFSSSCITCALDMRQLFMTVPHNPSP